ncbi:MAG: hypothetical protein QOH76_1014 [Thermoleophilaceae bacterium]|jgi:hypothetical protein|nr:hypothetical protein [Thermoleophilaceae bacterium]
MASNGWSTARLDELPTLDPDDLPAWKPVRHSLGLEAFGVNAWIGAQAGDEVIEEHDELGEDGDQEELYLVVAGRARFSVDGDRVDSPVGTLIAVRDPALTRAAVAEEPGTVILAVGGVRGAAFEPSGWELRRLAELP